MDEKRRANLRVWTPLIIALVLVFGMVLGFNMRDTLRAKRDIETVVDRNDRLEQIIDLINEKYVDTLNSNLLYQDAINGILKHLDPHTIYIPADELENVNEGLEGGFFGIGVEFSIVRDTIEVTSVIENGPAAHSGVTVGDQLIKVGDSVVAGTNITSERIIHMLKGKQYSHVFVTLRSADDGRERHVTITRDEIPIYSVDASIMLDSVTGYIKINRFSATTYDEFAKAFKKLKAQGMKRFVLDLRDNPGGYMDAATSIADEFIDDNKLLVFTKGEHSPKTEYKAGETGMFENGRLAVLVDENSASASEILAGAIQDWDRGVLVGRRTFGKGLVQEQYEMGDGAALRLTIAKYYTPSGRCIQRSFAKGKEAYEHDFEDRYKSGELTGKDSAVINDTTRYYTNNHRLVYGGGGVKPDVYVPYDTSKLSAGILSIALGDQLKTVLWDYFIHNRSRLTYSTIRQYDRHFNEEDVIRNLYFASLTAKEKKIAEKILSKPEHMQYFKLQVKAQLGRYLFRNNGYYAITAKDDNVIQKALHVLNSNEYSTILK